MLCWCKNKKPKLTKKELEEYYKANDEQIRFCYSYFPEYMEEMRKAWLRR